MARSEIAFAAAPIALTNSAATLWTTPAAGLGLDVVRHIHWNNIDSSARTWTLSIGTDGVTTEVFTASSIPANSYIDWYGQMALPAATIIQALASVSSKVYGSITGTRDYQG